MISLHGTSIAGWREAQGPGTSGKGIQAGSQDHLPSNAKNPRYRDRHRDRNRCRHSKSRSADEPRDWDQLRIDPDTDADTDGGFALTRGGEACQSGALKAKSITRSGGPRWDRAGRPSARGTIRRRSRWRPRRKTPWRSQRLRPGSATQASLIRGRSVHLMVLVAGRVSSCCCAGKRRGNRPSPDMMAWTSSG